MERVGARLVRRRLAPGLRRPPGRRPAGLDGRQPQADAHPSTRFTAIWLP
ncbi:hypothetical protein ACFWAZ_13910 [Streptomyces collinus]